jgi:hypothetical protein
MTKATFISISILMLAFGCARAAELIGIKTETGFLLLNQAPGNYFSIEIKASEMPEMGHFLVGKNQLQIASTSVSDFLDDPATLRDSRAVLEKHSESEKAYIEENVTHAPLVLTSHYENGSLYWNAKGSKIEFRVCTILHNQTVTMLTAIVMDPASADAVLILQKNSWATLKFRDAPWTISEIKAFSNRYRAKH